MQSSFLESPNETEIRYMEARKRDLLTELFRINKSLDEKKNNTTQREPISPNESTSELYLACDREGSLMIEIVTHRGEGAPLNRASYFVSKRLIERALSKFEGSRGI